MEEKLPELSPGDLASLVKALAQLGYTNESILPKLQKQVLRRLGILNPKVLSSAVDVTKFHLD